MKILSYTFEKVNNKFINLFQILSEKIRKKLRNILKTLQATKRADFSFTGELFFFIITDENGLGEKFKLRINS